MAKGYPLPVNRVDRYAEYARLLLEIATTTDVMDQELVSLACSYLDMAVREAKAQEMNGGREYERGKV